MWNRLVLCLVLAGCGFRSGASSGGGPDGLGGDGGPIDAAIDGPGGGPGDGSSGAIDCWSRWMNGSVQIAPTSVQEITELSDSTSDDRNPWISDDGKRLYFTRFPGMKGGGDIYRTSRGGSTGAFGDPTPVVDLNTNGQEGRAWLTLDERTLAISIQRGAVLDIELAVIGGGADFPSPDGVHTTRINGVGNLRFDPFLSEDGLHLYFSADSGPASKRELWFATRPDATADFGAPLMVPGVGGSGNNQADPALYQGELLLLFSTFSTSTKGQLWYARRSSTTASFGPPIQIPVDTNDDEFDPALGHDGCDLYFTSNRGGGKFHLFHAQVTK